jgi:hypothetical protein
MALPIFDAPRYTLTLPSSGERIEYRPFVVKEQKQLLMATQASLEEQIMAINRIIEACTFGKVRTARLPAFDVEYMFLQIRARSVGEVVDMVLTCECEAKQDTKLDISEVAVNKPEGHVTEIEVGSDVMVVMRYPTLEELELLGTDQSVDSIIRVIARSIESIWQGDQMYATTDYSEAELIEFVENLSPTGLEKMENFFATMPVLQHILEWDCDACGKHNAVRLEGVQSFFA